MPTRRVTVTYTARRKCFVLRWRGPDIDEKGEPKRHERKSSARNRAVAEREAADLEHALPTYKPDAITLEEFQRRNERERWKDGKNYCWTSLLKLVRAECEVIYVEDVTTEVLSRALALGKERGLDSTTLAGYVKHWFSALNWGKRLKLLDSIPTRPKVKVPKRRKKMRSRPPTLEEFERMVQHAESNCPSMVPVLMVCYYGGLRISEASALTQDWTKGFVIDLRHDPPLFRIKAGRDCDLPVPPDLVEYLGEFERWPKTGRMFRDVPTNGDTLGKKVAKIGKACGIIVNDSGKTCTAQDLRRAYATFWAKHLAPAELKELMRHADIKTTMDYYVDIERDHLAEKMRSISGAKGGAVSKNAKNQSERQDLNLRSLHPQ